MLRRSLLVFLAFLPMAALGTLGHELGHFAVGAVLAGDPVLHYGSVSWGVPGFGDDPLAIAGGPVANMVVGTVGLGLLHRARARGSPAGMAASTLLALFWSRQVFTAAGSVGMWLSRGIPGRTDEARLGFAMGVGPWPVALGTGAVGLVACVLTMRLVPAGWRAPLLAGGVAGSLAGFGVWYGWLGPVLLP